MTNPRVFYARGRERAGWCWSCQPCTRLAEERLIYYPTSGMNYESQLVAFTVALVHACLRHPREQTDAQNPSNPCRSGHPSR